MQASRRSPGPNANMSMAHSFSSAPMNYENVPQLSQHYGTPIPAIRKPSDLELYHMMMSGQFGNRPYTLPGYPPHTLPAFSTPASDLPKGIFGQTPSPVDLNLSSIQPPASVSDSSSSAGGLDDEFEGASPRTAFQPPADTPTSSAGGPTRRSRGKKADKGRSGLSGEDLEAYEARREKNNASARASRIRRAERERALQERCDRLEKEVAFWKAHCQQLAAEQNLQCPQYF
ncbi:hypothetical protein M3Y99_00143100 [Aphelenchoides fujianensis]|nr:hypothetical protein M3Y99_00143100 [Aphelenchoides fujianensis]